MKIKNKKINMINIFGYKYDERQNKYIVNEKQAEVVKVIYELHNKYFLSSDEIENLIKGKIDIDGIIANKIERLYEKLDKENLEFDNPFVKLNIANLLKYAYGLREHLIKHFKELNIKLEYANKMNENMDIEDFLNDADDIIKLLEDIYILKNKYSEFEEVRTTINEYIEQTKEITNDDNSYKDLIEKAKDIDKIYPISQDTIISEDLYKEILETLNNKNMIIEEIEK